MQQSFLHLLSAGSKVIVIFDCFYIVRLTAYLFLELWCDYEDIQLSTHSSYIHKPDPQLISSALKTTIAIDRLT